MAKTWMWSAIVGVMWLMAGGLLAEEPKLEDPSFVGTWMVFFNPKEGGGTQTLSVDVNRAGSYVATDMHGTLPPVTGRFEAKAGKFRLVGKDGATIDEGTYEPFGPQIQLTSARGKGHWSKVSAESKQGDAATSDRNPKAARLEPIVADAIRAARAKWKPDAILVEAKVVPNADGTLDLTLPGGNGYLRFLSPAENHGCLGVLGGFGEVNLYPEDKPVSASKWAIPSNVVGLAEAIRTAESERPGLVTEASLHGSGAETDLRQFCWVFTKPGSVVAVDALLGHVTDYREFMDGRPRAKRVPFSPNSGVSRFQTSFDGKGPPEMMWFSRHVIFLEGMEEAVIVEVPWRVVPLDEMRKHATVAPDGVTYRGESALYPLGDWVALEGEVRERFLRDADSIAIGCAPFGVRTEKPLSGYPPGTKERIVRQLESHWRAGGGK